MADRVMQEDGVTVVWAEHTEIAVTVEGYHCHTKECHKPNSTNLEKSTRMNANTFGEIAI